MLNINEFDDKSTHCRTPETTHPEGSDRTQISSVLIEPYGCAFFFDDKPEQTPNKTICPTPPTHTQSGFLGTKHLPARC